MTRPSCWSVAILGVLLVSGWAVRVLRITELKDQPAKYGNQSVTVNDVVTRSWGIPHGQLMLQAKTVAWNIVPAMRQASRRSRRGEVDRPTSR